LDKSPDLIETKTLPNWLRLEIGVERLRKHFVRHAASLLLRMTLRRRRGKSPLAMESINGRYCRSARGVMCERGISQATSRPKLTFFFREEAPLSPLRAFTDYLSGSVDAGFTEHSCRLWI
jgi:hypothetical protein